MGLTHIVGLSKGQEDFIASPLTHMWRQPVGMNASKAKNLQHICNTLATPLQHLSSLQMREVEALVQQKLEELSK